MSYPNHLDLGLKKLNFDSLSLTFEKIDTKRFPLLEYAYIVGKKGGLYPTVYNAANEALVNLFLQEKIKFVDIETILIKTIDEFHSNIKNPSLEEIIKTDEEIKRKVYSNYGFFN